MSDLEPNWWDFKYRDLTYSEKQREYDRDLRQWEQNQELKKNNQLIQQQAEIEKEKMRAERENAQLIAKNQRKAMLEAEEIRSQNEFELEEQRALNEQTNRYYNLCDKIGIEYDDLKKLEFWLNNITESQNNEYEKIISKINEFVYDKEIKDEIEKKNKLLYKIGYQVQKLKEIKIENIPKIKYMNKEIILTENQLNDTIEAKKKLCNSWKFSIVFYIVFLLLISGVLMINCFGYYLQVLAFPALGLLPAILFYRIYKSNKEFLEDLRDMQQKIKKLNDEKSFINNKINNLKEKANNQIKIFADLMEKRVNELDKNKDTIELINRLKNEGIMEELHYSYGASNITLNKINFNRFRINHYNQQMEQVFRKLNLDIEPVNKNEVEKEGTIEDYQNFIEEILPDANKIQLKNDYWSRDDLTLNKNKIKDILNCYNIEKSTKIEDREEFVLGKVLYRATILDKIMLKDVEELIVDNCKADSFFVFCRIWCYAHEHYGVSMELSPNQLESDIVIEIDKDMLNKKIKEFKLEDDD